MRNKQIKELLVFLFASAVNMILFSCAYHKLTEYRQSNIISPFLFNILIFVTIMVLATIASAFMAWVSKKMRQKN